MFVSETMSSEGSDAAAIDWEAVLQAESSSLKQLIVQRLGSFEGADDILQEVSIVALNSPSRPSDESEARGWLRGVVVRKVQDYWRKAGRQQRLQSHCCEKMSADDETLSPFEWLMHVERIELVRDALDQLEGSDRELLARKYHEGRTCGQLAKRFGVSCKAIECRLARARAKLRVTLHKLVDEIKF